MTDHSPAARYPELSTKDEALRVFSVALDDEYFSRLRALKRTRVVGAHGADFENRDARVERIVEKYVARAVKVAHKNALKAGWSTQQLADLHSKYGVPENSTRGW